ncbi:hypothetical protein [Actinomadura litoris]|uniref:hypothetical protein n=1 Tax=Actinomadura litoris TaxID=2678616 RepID=UPI001FA7503F|nr:hypothetical protein [Actinomadura litoris]
MARVPAAHQGPSRQHHGIKAGLYGGGGLLGVGVIVGGVLTFGPLPVIAILAMGAVILALIIVLIVVTRPPER